jgi:hypothetical protein
MVPIAEYSSTDIKGLTDYDAFVNEVLDSKIKELKIPDLEDKEFRTSQLAHDQDYNSLRISYTVGPNEYDYHLGEGQSRFENGGTYTSGT